ncbi:hypothetical protein EYZ11_002533 [Aspergillus tanneri]|uniref:Peptidase S33 tripeptidyl aminopeptidase-like C-terminal domain-containing protein n=1 Tax=Aspergillus tanneri TaxID=1220188 RepID=A0A4S3JQF8_9EURO|nr:hypothetical protein EYZ11_002533 [Aspergillus tanneri]
MDYNRPDGEGRRVAIAIARLPAKVPVTDPRYGGGPGGSGVAQALHTGETLQTVVDAADDPVAELVAQETPGLYFDIIGFDPRGVNNTTPGLSCFPDIFSQQKWELQAEADGMLSSSRDSLMRNWQRTKALNKGCSSRLSTAPEEGQEALGENLNTPPVASDMLEIVERHAEWRERQGQAEQRRYDRARGYDPEQSIRVRTKWKRDQEKLLYWGRSYGTILGSTFATMYPDRVARAVLDGVVDMDKYYMDKGQNPVIDADKIFDRFLSHCISAEAGKCPLYGVGGVADIKSAYLSLESALYNASLSVPASETRGPEVITWTDLRLILRIAMYLPLVGFPLLAQYTKELLEGNGSSMADFKQRLHLPSCPSSQCVQDGPWSPSCQMPGANEVYASMAILCTDAEYLQDIDEERFQDIWRTLREDSYMLGDYWAQVRLGCVGWNVKAKWQVPVSYGANTSYPLLFVNNMLDPVTPLRRKNSRAQRYYDRIQRE